MTMYRSLLNLGGKEKVVVAINHKEGNSKGSKSAGAPAVNVMHHIHVLDRSGSMQGEIRELIEDVKKTLDMIPDTDYVSVIWFSSELECKVLVKGAKKDDNLYKLLDSIKSTLSTTCFSVPMHEVGEIVNDLYAICPNFNVTLFTDGEPVVNWSVKEEIQRIFKEIDSFRDKVLAINTVGYRWNYNRELLLDIAHRSEFGEMIHSGKITEYKDIFQHNYERVAELVREPVDITCLSSDIVYVNKKSTKLEKEHMKLSALDSSANMFYIIMDTDLIFNYNGEFYDSKDIKPGVLKNSLTKFYYAYASELFNHGERQKALDILAKTVKDKYFVDRQVNVYTVPEVGEYAKELSKAVFNAKHRHLNGECSDNYLPADDAICVMDILKMLAEGDNYYVYSSNYNRIGRITEDTFNLFQKKDEIPKTPINELVFNKEKLNVSIRSKINGTVKLNPVRAKSVGLPDTIDSYIYRNQTIIKDGNLNMDKITVVFDVDTANKLSNKLCVLSNDLGFEVIDFELGSVEVDGSSCPKGTIDLSRLPVINRQYISKAGETSTVLKTVKEIAQLEAKQKVANSALKDIKENVEQTAWQEAPYKELTLDQIAVLQEHGLDKNLCYEGVAVKMADKNENDFYEARELEFQLKGAASVPKVSDASAKFLAGKKLNFMEQVMVDYMGAAPKEFLNPLYERNYWNSELRRVRSELLKKRIDLNSMKIAKVLTGDWFRDTVADSKGNFTYSDGSDTLVIKTDRVKVYY